MKNILITGATGQLGTAVITTLLKSVPPEQISVLTRNEEKHKAFQEKGFRPCLGSYDNIDALEKAMEGVDMVLLISSGDQGDRMQEHKNVVDSAREAGVNHIAYTSRCLRDKNSLANKLMVEHFQTEDYIFSSGLNYTIFRNALYMDAIPQFIGGKAALERGIFLPAGDGKVAFALRSEMGEAMAIVLGQAPAENRIYNFTGNEAYSFDDVAAMLSSLSGKHVRYTNTEEAAFAEMMKTRHLPASAIRKIIDFITDIKENQEAESYSDLKDILGRKPASLKDGLKLVFDL
jgi:NAD(P)H dehydrogenase (quinone)